MFQIEKDGDDIVVRNVVVTAFGGGHDLGDNGRTESGIMNDGSNPKLLGCALPIRSTESATRNSPLACATKPHIPWGTKVLFWGGHIEEADAIETALIDNGPDVLRYPTHAGDLTVYAAGQFNPLIPITKMANNFMAILSYRIIGGAKYVA